MNWPIHLLIKGSEITSTCECQKDTRKWYYEVGQGANLASEVVLRIRICLCLCRGFCWLWKVLSSMNTKHCQRHNGPEGWVHITSSNKIFDQVSSSKSRPSINFKISTKHQPLHKTWSSKSWPNLASESRPRFTFIREPVKNVLADFAR